MSAKMATGNAASVPAVAETTDPGVATTGAGPANAAAADLTTASPKPAAPEGKELSRGTAPRPGLANVRGMAERLARCLEMLGLKPGASFDEINTTYFTILKRLPESPTADDEAYMRELRRAYDILRRTYVSPQKKAVQVLFDNKRLAIPLLGVATVVLAGVLLYLNWGTIKLQTTHYEPGAVLRLKSASAPFGTIVGYDAAHRFPAGRPGAAYEVRLADKPDTVWVSERIIVNGMVPVSK
jgi:hypothetical protein